MILWRIPLLLCALALVAASACLPRDLSPNSAPASPTPRPEFLPTPIGGGDGRIAFASYRDGESEIFLIRLTPLGITRLTDMDERVSKPSWSPDGTRIALVVTDDQFNLDIYLMNADGSDLVRLTDQYWVDTEPTWSPDGSKIAFSTDRDSYVTMEEGLVYDFEIYTMSPNGSDQVNLTNTLGWDTAPDWSPDGTRILFQSDRDGNVEIYLMESDGSEQTNLTNNPADDAAPSWSPDGGKVAFHSDRSGVFDIYVMNADGTGLVRLTDSPDWDIEPSWSPDGELLAYYSRRDGNFEVYFMNADGTSQIRLTDHGDFDGFPDWYP
jgi:Tol biopolymer transport system component